MSARTLLRLAAPAALLLAGACAMPFHAELTRFQQLPPPQGQTFAIQSADPQNQGGIEFGMYARLVTQRLAAQGYTPVAEGAPANLIVSLDYGVDNGHEKVVSDFGYPGFGYGGFGYGGFGGFGYGSFGYGGFGRGFYGGFGDPFFGGFGYGGVESYTFYVSHLDMKIRSSADARVLFEGRARARSTSDSLQRLVPHLVDAMFTGFPGRSGEDVMVSVPPPPKTPTITEKRG